MRVLSTSDADEPLRAEIRAVSEEWRGNWPERGFTMAMDALFLYPDTVLAVAVAPDGSVGGFLQLVPSPASEGYSLASMRRRRDTPNGLMEYLITETVAWARAHSVTEVSLNFAVFADFLRADEDAGALTRAARWGLLKADRLFQVERLHSFNRKFFPHWRRRYFCFERWGDLPLAGLAYLHAESLLDAARAPGSRQRTWQHIEVAARARGKGSSRPSRPSRCSGAPNTDWGRFGYDAARHNVSPDTTITAANVSRLVRRQVHLDGTVDSSPIYARGLFVVTTTYGRTEALNADTGKVVWRFTPPSYASLAGTARITNATPAASTDRTAVYAAAPDGRIRKLRVSDGKVLWTTAITRDPTHEKITSSLNVSRGLVIATTGGYIGDAPPYQGHVVTMSERTGRIAHVWNSLCSNRHALIVPSTCASSDSAIWSSNGAAVDPDNGDLVVATGNAPFNGSTNWGDSVLVLSPDAGKLLRHWTPADQAHLNDTDLDLGSTSPALLPTAATASRAARTASCVCSSCTGCPA